MMLLRGENLRIPGIFTAENEGSDKLGMNIASLLQRSRGSENVNANSQR